jgi:hypothetical protein
MIREIVLLPSDPNDDSAKSRPDPLWVLAQVARRVAQKRIAAGQKPQAEANVIEPRTEERHQEGS